MQQTPRRRGQNQATHATDSVQRCKRTRAHASCHMKHTASPHFVCGEQRAADKQQHARSIVLDNQCATRHRRHTQDATHDRCRRMQQTHDVRDETNGISSSRSEGLKSPPCSGCSACCSMRLAIGLHVHRGESVSHTLVDPRQLASDARMPTICVRVRVGLLRRRLRLVPAAPRDRDCQLHEVR